MSSDRPTAPPNRTPGSAAGAGVALGLALAVAWLLRDLAGRADTLVLGAPGTDALRGLWSLDHLAASLLPPNTPLWSRHVNLPAGAFGLALPFVSGVLVAPVRAFVGPVLAYNLLIAALLWSAAAASAWLGRQVSGSWAAGLAVGGVVLAQPMMVHAIYDGTPEHAALWALPVTLGLAWRALGQASPRSGVLAGVLGALLALDSPYYAVFCAVLAAVILPFAARGGVGAAQTGRAWSLGAMVGTSALLGAGVLAIYAALPTGSGGGLGSSELQSVNVTDLGTWRQVERGGWTAATGPAPTLLPTPILWISLGLAILGGWRALPWALAGLLSLSLSFGTSPKLLSQLGERLGGPGEVLAEVILALNRLLYALPGLSGLRFPSRWLVPAALLLAVAGSVGLERLIRRIPRSLGAAVGALLAIAALSLSARAGSFRDGVVGQDLPKTQFTSWIASQPEDGAVALLPVLRAAPPGVGRNDRPVFADLDPAMAGMDAQVLQVLHGRAQVGAPGLQTLRPLVQDSHVARVLRDWDDLTHPKLTGEAIPPGASDPRADRARGEGVRQLITAGLRWVAVDLGAYDEAGLTELLRQLQPFVTDDRRFDEGDGVRVLTLALPSP